MSNIPSNLKYTEEHLYVRLENNIATVGITEHGGNTLGEVIMVELPKVGDKSDEGERLGEAESTKGVTEIYSPLAGTIEAVNEELGGSPELINDDPYGEGWIIKITVDDPSSVEKLLSASQYEEFLKEG